MSGKGSLVCKRCLEEDPTTAWLLKTLCNRSEIHSLNEPQVLVTWSGTKKRLVVVEGNPPIRPIPKRSISGHQFILCDGTRCKGERCSYAHSFEELDAWNEERKKAESRKVAGTDKARTVASTGPGFQAQADVKRAGSLKSQGDQSSMSLSCDEFSECDSVGDYLATGKEDEWVESSIPAKWSAKEIKRQVLTRESYRQYHQRLLMEDEKSHANLLKRCDGFYNVKLLQETPEWVPKPKPKHVLYAHITGLTNFQVLFAIHDSQPETVSAMIQLSGHNAWADIVRHTHCSEEGTLYFLVAMDKANSKKFKKEFQAPPNESDPACKYHVYFKAKKYNFCHWQRSIQNLPDSIIKRITPDSDSFVSIQRCTLTEDDKKVLKLKQCSDDQAEALKTIIALPPASPPLLISGPFGTGKTHVLILAANHILQALDCKDTKVLVCCQSPTSADHFLEHYQSTHIRPQESISIIKLCSFENPKVKHCQSISSFVSTLGGPTNGKKMLVIATFHDSMLLVRELQKQKLEVFFTYIMMDESAQAREAEAIAPLYMANDNTRIVITGDCQEVGPTSMLNGSDYQSLLGRLEALYFTVGDAAKDYMLCLKTVKYPSHPDIVKFCTGLFYGQRLLQPSHSEADQFPLLFVCTSIKQDPETTDTSVHGNGASLALEQIYQLHEMWQAGWGQKDLAQACFVASNKIEFGNLHDLIQRNSPEVGKIKLLTTSNIQGCELRAVLISTAEPIGSSWMPLCASRSIWNPRVFNTILSRAQSLIIAMGNPFLLLKMEHYMVMKYGESWRCWSHYLLECLEHNTLTFDPTLKLGCEEQLSLQSLHTLCAKAAKDRIQQSDVDDEDLALSQPDKKGITADEDDDHTSSHVSLQTGGNVITGEEGHRERQTGEVDHRDRQIESRLGQDYHEIIELGRGGYAVVYRAKHKVDHQDYAIKVIKLPSDQQGQENVLKEVKCLSQLAHKNILRYFNSWKEDAPVGGNNSVWWEALQQLNSESYSWGDRSSYGFVITKGSEEQSLSSGVHSNGSSVDNAAGSSGSPSPQESTLHASTKSDTVVTFDRGGSLDPQPTVRRLTALCIQTELCHNTLKQWLEDTINKRNRKMVVNFFEQMLEAVAYIHKEKLIHRDLKPANIFMTANDVLKVGDFGLVTGAELQAHNPDDEQDDHSHTIGAGTKLYMSPEQESNSHYNEKVDIYSLGLIFFEMNCPTGSYQERDKIFSALKHQQVFPAAFGKNEHPRERTIILQMVRDNPESRPSADTILRGEDLKRLKKVIRRSTDGDACIKRL